MALHPNRHQASPSQFLTLITVGSTQFENLITNIINRNFISSINSLSQSIRKNKQDPVTNKLIVQIGHSRLDLSEIIQHIQLIQSDQQSGHPIHHSLLISEIHRFNSGGSTHLNLLYSTRDHDQVQLVIFRFSHSIDQLLSISNLSISHAGAGSILASIKPIKCLTEQSKSQSSIQITKDFNLMIHDEANHNANHSQKTQDFKQLIIVPNRILMDDHQLDLANQISSLGLALTCQPEALIETIHTIKSNLDVSHPSSSKRQSCFGPNHPTLSDPYKFKKFLDNQRSFCLNSD